MEKTLSGYMLVEMVAAMAIGLIVLGTIVSSFAVGEAVYRDQTEGVRMLESLRAGMEVMSRDILRAGGIGTIGIRQARSDFLEIMAADEEIPIVYRYWKGKVTRCDQPLVENVPEGGLRFTFFDAEGVQLDPPISDETCYRIRRIGVSLTVSAKPSPDNRIRRSHTLSTSVALRNPPGMPGFCP